ncbi:EAL domain-containing response regulator [Orrella marina]|nr:EAL domain-containing response regulator [Orrella marina]
MTDSKANAAGSILILDDDESVTNTARIIARRAGFDVRASLNATDFFKSLRDWQPDCVLVDLAMPDMDGIQVLRELQVLHYPGRVILTSGLSNRILEAAGRTATEYGLNLAGILPKPFTPEMFRSLLGAGAEKQQVRNPTDQIVDEDMLVQAIKECWIEPYFQPKFTCQTQRLCGFEALARLNHPEFGMISPDSFIPLAERTGLITPLTLQILESAVLWLKQLDAYEIGLAVNLSRSQTDPALADQLLTLSSKHGVSPGRITLEVTETAQHQDPMQLLEFLTRYRIQGFHLSLDDFGVGYSSLVELARLPFSEIKIDKRFVGNLAQSTESQKICAAIIGLGQAMGLEVTAEGVENQHALDFLAQAGCDKVQGYYFSRPMPGYEALRWSRQYSSGASAGTL